MKNTNEKESPRRIYAKAPDGLKSSGSTKGYSLMKKAIAMTVVLTLTLGSFTTALAYDALAPVTELVINEKGRDVTYYDIYGGTKENRPDTSDETKFYMDVVGNQDNLLKWANLAYNIFSSENRSYWDHAGNGWDHDFGKGHYMYFIDDMMASYSRSGDDAKKSTGISIANSLYDVQQRAANDVAGLIHRKLKGSDFMNVHAMDALTSTSQPVIYSTISQTDRYGKTSQFGYNSFTIAFYDFQLHVVDDGKALNTVTGDASLEEATSNPVPGFSYSVGETESGLINTSHNNSLQAANATLSLQEGSSSTVSSTITNSDNLTFGRNVGVTGTLGAKIPLIGTASMSLSGTLSFSEAIGTSYSEQDSITKNETKSSSISLSVPPHTVVGANETKATTKMTTTYDCPVSVSYKVAIFSMNGTVYDDNASIRSFTTSGYDQRSFITVFGSENDVSDGIENLYQRASQNKNNSSYEETYGYTRGTNRKGDIWLTKLNWDSITKKGKPGYNKSEFGSKLTSGDAMINALINRYPMSLTGASTSIVETGINAEVATPIPMYPISYIFIKYQLNRNFNLQVGEQLPINSYRVTAYDQDMAPYYGFSAAWGEWKIVDADGNPTNSNVAKMVLDPVTHQQCIIASAEGTAYVKYFIKEGVYVDYSGRESTNDSITSPAYKITVSAAEAEKFSGRIDLTGEVTATVDDAPINLNAVEGLDVAAYDTTDKQVDIQVEWEAQELPKSGINVSADGTLTVTQPGTFHVRAFHQDVYSDWAEVKAVEAVDELEALIITESTVTVNEHLEGVTKFDPDNMMTRAEFIKLLHSLSGKPSGAANAGFEDVDITSAYAACLAWAKEKGIVSGGTNGSFDPDAGLTKQQMAIILYNTAKAAGMDINLSSQEIISILSKLTDGNQVKPWASDAMAFAIKNGYIQPDENEKINANDFVEKDEAAEVLVDIVTDADMIPEETAETFPDEETTPVEETTSNEESADDNITENESSSDEDSTLEENPVSENESANDEKNTSVSEGTPAPEEEILPDGEPDSAE